MTHWWRLLPFALGLVLGLDGAGHVQVARAENDDEALPVAEGLVLDGRLDEPAWAGARRLAVSIVERTEPSTSEPYRLTPDVRVLVSEGWLWVGAAVSEPPGVGMGLRVMLAPPSVTSAADALAVAFTPQALRGPRYGVRGPRGVGRAAYRLDGAADVRAGDSWSVELRLALADLVLSDRATPLHIAAVVQTRVPTQLAWAPPTAAFAPPTSDRWATVGPPAPGRWPEATADDGDVAAREAEDARDAERLDAWRSFETASRSSVDLMLRAAGLGAVSADVATPDDLLTAARKNLLVPLERVSDLRPDLAFAHVVRGHLLHDLGLDGPALAAFDAALQVVPGLPEAKEGTWLAVRGEGFARGPVGEGTDYAAAFARVEQAAAEATDPVARDGVTLGRALLHYYQGDFEVALRLLDPLARRYPAHPSIRRHADRAGRGVDAWPRERAYRQRDEARGDLPRVRLETTRGSILLELFEDDFPNTVKNFVWLAQHGFYDDTAFDRVVPFLGVQGGDPRTRADPSSSAGPGYAIPDERPPSPRAGQPRAPRGSRMRRLFRGVLAHPAVVPSGAQYRILLTTGSALHLDDGYVALGRILAGREVAEILTAADRLVEAQVVRTRPDVTYRPETVEGGPAPVPR